MPNDCWNKLHIAAEEDVITTMYNNEFSDINKESSKVEKYSRGLIIKMWSPWEPDYLWLETLIDKYECNIKNEWNEEGGYSGVWLGSKKNNEKNVTKLMWDYLCIEGLNHHFTNNNVPTEK